MNAQAWKYLAGFYRGSGGRILLAFGMSVLQAIVVLPAFGLVRRLVDVEIPQGNQRQLIMIGCALAGLTVAGIVLSLLTRRITLLVNTATIRRMREDLIRKHYQLSLSFTSKSDRGKLHTLLLQDVGNVEAMSDTLVATVLPSMFFTIVLAGVMCYLNWALFLVLLVLFPFLFLTTHRSGLALKARVDAFRTSFQNLSKSMWFVLWMVDLTRFQAAERFEIAKQNRGFEEFQRRSIDVAWSRTMMTSLQRLVSGLSGIVVLVAGGIAIGVDAMSLGALVSFYIAARLLQAHATPLLAAVATVITGNESLGAIFELADTKELAPYGGARQISFKGALALRDASFAYGRHPVLNEACMVLNPGETVLVLGPNGAGKSTIINLLLGYYRPQSGTLDADDVPYGEVDMFHLRRQIGVVPQNPQTFAGTILENIVYGTENPSMGDVIEAAQNAGCHEFISKLSLGYDSPIGDNGVLVSGGEIQLIAICRALLRKPRLLILDEPTNHLGKEAVRDLLGNLRVTKGDRTTLVISHHWEIAKEADRVYYLEFGRLREIEMSELGRLAEVLEAAN